MYIHCLLAVDCGWVLQQVIAGACLRGRPACAGYPSVCSAIRTHAAGPVHSDGMLLQAGLPDGQAFWKKYI